MSRPEDIPQDVWDAAEAVGEAIYGRHERGWVMWPLVSEHGNPAQEIVARAILAAKAEAEAERDMLQDILDARPAINAALPDSYIKWSQAIYSGEATRAYIRKHGVN